MFGTGSPFGASPRTAIEHPTRSETLTVHPVVGHKSGTPIGGEARTIRGQVGAPDSEDFEVMAIGQEEDLAFVLIAMADADLDRDDRVYYESEVGREPYRVTAPQPTTMRDETVVRWALIPDTRGDFADGTGGDTDPDDPDGSDPDDSDPNSGSDDDGNYEDGPPLFPS